jgi:hypothetical protein
MTKKFTREELEAHIVTIQGLLDISRATAQDLEIDNFAAHSDADKADSRFETLRDALSLYGQHTKECFAWLFDRVAGKLHWACDCGWNHFATELERVQGRYK